MIFQLLKNHRTTLPPLTRLRMGISLAVVAVGVFSAAAQPPVPNIPPTPNFQPYPTVPPSASPPMVQPPSAPSPLPRLVPADAPNPVNPSPQGRTVTFQKPAGKDVAVPTVLGTMPAPPPATPTPVGMQPRQLVPADRQVMTQTPPTSAKDTLLSAVAPSPSTPAKATITRENAFRLMSDAELDLRMVDELMQQAREDFEKKKKENIAKLKADLEKLKEELDSLKKKLDRQEIDPRDYQRKLEEIQEKEKALEKEFKSNFDANAARCPPPTVTPLVPVGTVYQPKTASYPPAQTFLEPKYVVHRRLLFEEKNSERYGWDLGIIQPVVSTAFFYKDVLMWPSHLASHLWERYDTSAGKCPPGSPVPYFLYPPEVDILGLGAGASVMVGAAFIFP